jgi:hypothetical protein
LTAALAPRADKTGAGVNTMTTKQRWPAFTRGVLAVEKSYKGILTRIFSQNIPLSLSLADGDIFPSPLDPKIDAGGHGVGEVGAG